MFIFVVWQVLKRNTVIPVSKVNWGVAEELNCNYAVQYLTEP